MPNKVKVAGKALVLNGMGIREATVFKVDVYVAGLYLEKKSNDSGSIISSEQAKRLVLKFVREVDREDMVKAWRTGFGGKGALAARVGKLSAYMADLEEGDTMTFTYLPGKGTEVKVKGKRRGVIEGDDFGRALFAIWLGSSPPNAGLKMGLLAG